MPAKKSQVKSKSKTTSGSNKASPRVSSHTRPPASTSRPSSVSRSAGHELKKYFSHGLTADQAHRLHQKFGPNQLQEKPPPSDLTFFLAQFKNPLVAVLVVAGLTTVFLSDFTDTLVIGLAVAVNTALGFIQERKAYKSLASLKKVLTPQAWVTRDDQRQKIDATTLVPGDLVHLYQGDKVPADGILITATGLTINEAVLTGESLPVTKSAVDKPLLRSLYITPRPDEEEKFAFNISEFLHQTTNNQKLISNFQVYMGTVVAAGSALMLVTRIGMDTEMGKIAAEVGEHLEAPTPLELRLSQLAKWLTISVIFLALFVFLFGILNQHQFKEMFTVSVALAVAAIPEGLVVALTVILAVGMQRILKNKAVVRKLVAAETLGSVTTVCVDKTGTLTQGQLQVIRTEFTRKKLGLRASVLANDLRDPTELARWDWARDQLRPATQSSSSASALGPQRLLDRYPRDDSIPFSVDHRFLATRHGKEIFLVGAPELLLAWSGASSAKLQTNRRRIESWGERGWRMIGFAYLKSSTPARARTLFSHLKAHRHGLIKPRWLGLMAFADPVRPGVKSALKRAAAAGIQVKVITGDYRGTAEAVLRQLDINIKKDQVIEGFELEKLTDAQLAARVKDLVLFARTLPTQKLRIVKCLKDQGEIVGMMGDGVNDAPALAAADIGMVVGDASEVARETADLVLLDSNFATILSSIEEGRGIFDNLRKIILYLLSDTFSEVILVVGSLLMGWPLAISAAQILWINLIDDGLPNLALTIDPKTSDLLRRSPLDPQAPLINAEIATLIAAISLVTGLSSLIAFGHFLPELDAQHARSIVYAVLSLDSLLYVFSCRTLKKSLWHEDLLANPWLIGASLFGLLLTLAGMYVSVFQNLLGLTPLNLEAWAVVIAISLGVVAVIEAVKLGWSRLLAK
jgi:Ca2+-transporting ATPase